MNSLYDVIIIGAGAAGMMCAIEAGKRGRRVLLLDHSKKIAEKIRISGGGRCNFTNLHARPACFLSENVHFCKSALARYTQQDFMVLLRKHDVSYHEKKLGQLFCDERAVRIIDLLLEECALAGVEIVREVVVDAVNSCEGGYKIHVQGRNVCCESLVVATGGLSIPKIGASKFGYDLARRFGLNVIETRAGLVPFTFQSALLDLCKSLAGVSVEAVVSCGDVSFSEGLLFTHRGLSGPSILQISSYWREGGAIVIDLSPEIDVLSFLKTRRGAQPKQEIHNALCDILPRRLAERFCEMDAVQGRLADLPDKALDGLARALHSWCIKPSGTEGYRTAEVTLGGVDTAGLSSKTMEAKAQSGLYFIGEVVDVTGHLGGFNFQWAWSSGYVAGQYV